MAALSLRETFLYELTNLGGSAGNGRLRDTLEWKESTFEEIKALLIAEGVIKPGRGRGGSVRLAEAESAAPLTMEPPLPASKPAKAKSRTSTKATKQSAATIGFEAKLWLTVDKLRNNIARRYVGDVGNPSDIGTIWIEAAVKDVLGHGSCVFAVGGGNEPPTAPVRLQANDSHQCAHAIAHHAMPFRTELGT